MPEDRSFVPAFGNKPRRLVGRDEEIAGFLRGLAGPPGHRDRATLCLGQRGMGKTALLLKFAELAESHGFVAAKATAGVDLLVQLIEGIQAAGSKYVPSNRRFTGVSVGALGFSVGLSFTDDTERKASFRAKLSLLCQALENHEKGVLLLVDEVTADDEQIRQLATAYQELVGEGRNIAIAMAGLPAAVSSVLNDKVLTFLNRARKIQLGPLPLADVTVDYFNTFKELGKSISVDDLGRAVAATMGYPYLLQLIGYYLLEFTGADSEISSATVDLAINTSRTAMVDGIFTPSLSPLSKRDREFLEAMSLDDETSDIADITQRLGVTAASAQQTRRRLIASGVIIPSGTGQLQYALPYLGPFFRGTL
ncbi:MAG: ATP-binding protein [Propionibacteriaceae bacterium]|jgi:hypothetical protein|nr:ATP-binding protein [Propionibacteriaceae bacterium]